LSVSPLGNVGDGVHVAQLSGQYQNATIRGRSAMIIPKRDFDEFRESHPGFGDIFSELAKQRAVAGSTCSAIRTRAE